MADARDKNVWSRHAIEDHSVATPYEKSELVENLLSLTKGVKTVWDLGCGSGLWRPIFRDYDYVGIDQNQDMINVGLSREYNINKKTQFTLHNLREDFNSLKVTKPDLIWLSAVLQHNRHEPDKREVLENISNILDSGKYLMFTENTFTQFNHNPPFLTFYEGCTDGWSFTQKGWKEYIEDFGFKLLNNDTFNFYLFKKK